jgi:hypothetical protein
MSQDALKIKSDFDKFEVPEERAEVPQPWLALAT